MKSVLKHHFIFDPAAMSPEVIKKFGSDTAIFINAKNQETGAILGYVSFLMKSDYPQGTVKIMGLAVKPEYQNCGLAKLMVSSIFRIIPKIEHIFLCTRVTNANAIRAYQAWGFVKGMDPIQDPHYTFNLNHWIFLEYKANAAQGVQKLAQELK